MTPPFVHRLRVRYHECDAQGIVFNANHFAFFDVALTELWRETFGSYAALLEAGSDLLVREATATFHAPARFDDLVDVELTIAHLGTTSMVMSIEERREGELLVDGRLVHVFVDPATHAKHPIPGAVRSRLEAWCAPKD
jgi:acyl-CoA thioester hydrolase